MNGWTKDLSQQERDENELQAIGELLQSDPTNEYWRARFEGAPHPVDEAQEIERAIDAELSPKPEMWDFTPFPANMPDIDMDTVDEIPF